MTLVVDGSVCNDSLCLTGRVALLQLCDGCFDVLVLRDGVSRSTILSMFLEMEKGTCATCRDLVAIHDDTRYIVFAPQAGAHACS